MVIKRGQMTKEARQERLIVTGMIVSPEFLRRMVLLHRQDSLISEYAKTVAKWCIDFYGQYKTAPMELIQDIFVKERNSLDPDTAELVSDYLQSLSDDFERKSRFNVEYVSLAAVELFQTHRIKVLIQETNALISQGKGEKASELLEAFKKREKIDDNSVFPFEDEKLIDEAFSEDLDPLFTYEGAMGQFLNPLFVREGFIGIVGPEKRGKSRCLGDFILHALKDNCNVVLFDAGDSSRKQIIRRFCVSLAQRHYHERYCGKQLIPVLDCAYNQDNTCTLKKRTSDCGALSEGTMITFEEAARLGYKACTACSKNFKGASWFKQIDINPLTSKEAKETIQRFNKRWKSRFKMSCHPTKTLDLVKMEQLLEQWEIQEGFIPDVIIVDYADILSPSTNTHDFRHQENSKWEDLRKLSQKRKCLVITATQSSKASYEKKSVGKGDMSEDKRKASHVTAMLTLNQVEEERKRGRMRIGLVYAREEEITHHEVILVQSFKTGQFCIDSYF
jgi:hypothetical protein